jgi:hypothetical protein
VKIVARWVYELKEVGLAFFWLQSIKSISKVKEKEAQARILAPN